MLEIHLLKDQQTGSFLDLSPCGLLIERWMQRTLYCRPWIFRRAYFSALVMLVELDVCLDSWEMRDRTYCPSYFRWPAAKFHKAVFPMLPDIELERKFGTKPLIDCHNLVFWLKGDLSLAKGKGRWGGLRSNLGPSSILPNVPTSWALLMGRSQNSFKLWSDHVIYWLAFGRRLWNGHSLDIGNFG